MIIYEDQKAYLIGKRYQEEKTEEGRPKIDSNVGTVHTLSEGNLGNRRKNSKTESKNRM